MNETFGQRLSRLRKEKGLTQEDIASRITISPQAVSKWENGNSEPDLDTLNKLADILNCSVDSLLGREEQVEVEEEVKETPKDSPKEEKGQKELEKELEERASEVVEKHIFYRRHKEDEKFFWLTSGVLFGVALLVYLLMGFLWKDQNMGWKMGWLVFFIPWITTSLVEAIRDKYFCKFAYPLLATAVYLLLGYLGDYIGFQGWSVYWFLFITIPAFYLIFGPIDTHLKHKRGDYDDDDDDEDEDEDDEK